MNSTERSPSVRLSDSLKKYDQFAADKIVEAFRDLSKENLAFLLEHSNPANVIVQWLKQGKHSLRITREGLESYWIERPGDRPSPNVISFQEFHWQVSTRLLLEAERHERQWLLNDWDDRLNQEIRRGIGGFNE